ncbi:MAG TPA: glycosyltransferase family 4 protein [Phycisphaerae bacterium]|nr:glycosyltransferase family 4 protein [Phycisphaerae bacterium]
MSAPDTQRPLRITFVLEGRGLSGGVRVVVHQANLLRARGHNVTIVTRRVPYPRKVKSFAKRLRWDFQTAIGSVRDHVDDFAGPVHTVAPQRMAARVPDGDAVIATYWTTAQPVMDLPPRCGRKFYFVQHYEAHTNDPEQVDATLRLPMRKLVVARWLQTLLRDRFDDDDAVLVSNGVDLELFDAPRREPHNPPCVGVMYSRIPWKGTAVAFDAIARARREIPDLAVVAFGSERPNNDLPLPPGTDYRFCPPQAQIRSIYAAADVWLCPSTTEGFALPPLEAMACRCPAISTRCGGPEDFVEEGYNGYLVDVGDSAAMAQRLVELLRDPARLRTMAEHAYVTRLRFTWKRAVDRFEAALRDDQEVLAATEHQAALSELGSGQRAG